MISSTVYDGFLLKDGQFDTAGFVESFLIYETILISNPATFLRVAESIEYQALCGLLEEGRFIVECGGPTAQVTCDYLNPGVFTDQPLNLPLRYALETIFVNPELEGNLSVEDRLMRTLLEKLKKLCNTELLGFLYQLSPKSIGYMNLDFN